MKKIGVTGIMGSGKTFVCNIFATMGIPVFNADEEAKKLYKLPEVVEQVKALLGEDVYDTYNNIITEKVANIVFLHTKKLTELENILHPLVLERFHQWAQQQKAPYCIMENALIFEKKWQHHFDATILVYVTLELQLKRLIEKYGVLQKHHRIRMNLQYTQRRKKKMANFVIFNDDSHPLLPQIWKIHQEILSQ